MSRCLSWSFPGLRASALVALALGALAFAPAPAAMAAGFGGSSSLGNLTEGSAEEQATTATTSTTASTESENHKSSSITAVLIAVGLVLLLGVAFVIVRDARRWAPAADGELAETASGHSQAALQKRRAKAKAARKQRKRNR
jgi:hypothetical protein